MIINQPKAESVFKPWWDHFYKQTVFAAIGLCLLLYFTSNQMEKEVFVHEGSQNVADKSSSNDLSKSINATETGEDDPGPTNDNAKDNSTADISKMLQKMISFTNSDLNAHIISRTKRASGQPELGFSLYMLVIFCALILIEQSYDRLFYSHHIVQTLCHLLEFVSDLRQFRWEHNTRIFNSTLHHAHHRNRNGLRWLFDLHNAIRLILTFILFGVSLNEYFKVATRAANDNTFGGSLTIMLLMVLLIVFQIILLLYGISWPWTFAYSSSWGNLMTRYANAVDQIDITRGRCVPSPPFHKQSAQRVLNSLNPYSASDDLRLILDLIAYKSGLGLALKVLSRMEPDMQNNWRPYKAVARITEGKDKHKGCQVLEVSWKDPLVVLYLMPIPAELNLHFGIDITHGSRGEHSVRIVGYDERRYYQRVWHASRPSSVKLKMSESFNYMEQFTDVTERLTEVDIWTIVDGQMVAKSSAKDEHFFKASAEQAVPEVPLASERLSGAVSTPNLVPKPPRHQQVVKIEAAVPVNEANEEDCECASQEQESCDHDNCQVATTTIKIPFVSNCQRIDRDDDDASVNLTGSESSLSTAKAVSSVSDKAHSLTNISHVSEEKSTLKKTTSVGNKLQGSARLSKDKKKAKKQKASRYKDKGQVNEVFEPDDIASVQDDRRHMLI